MRPSARSRSHLTIPRRCRCSVPLPSGTSGTTRAPRNSCAVPSHVSRARLNRRYTGPSAVESRPARRSARRDSSRPQPGSRTAHPRSLEGQFLVMARRYDEALAQLDSVVELMPRFVQGRRDACLPVDRPATLQRGGSRVRHRHRARSPHSPFRLGWGTCISQRAACLRARQGRPAGAEAEAALERIRRQERETRVRPVHVALMLHGLGRDSEALHELSRAVDGRDPSVTFLGVDPRWDGLRTSPSFQALLSRVNLLEVSNRVLNSGAGSAGR